GLCDHRPRHHADRARTNSRRADRSHGGRRPRSIRGRRRGRYGEVGVHAPPVNGAGPLPTETVALTLLEHGVGAVRTPGPVTLEFCEKIVPAPSDSVPEMVVVLLLKKFMAPVTDIVVPLGIVNPSVPVKNVPFTGMGFEIALKSTEPDPTSIATFPRLGTTL